MTTKKPRLPTTTEYSWINDHSFTGYDDYYPSVDPKSRKYFFSNFNDYVLIIIEISFKVELIYHILTIIGFFLNLIHLLILTRKELRSNLVYIVMIGVCISDIMQCLGTVPEMTQIWENVNLWDSCVGSLPYFRIVIMIISKTIKIMGRRCSSLLSLYIATVRAFSVIFPMSTVVNKLTKPGVGIIVMVIIALISTSWSLIYFFKTKIVEDKRCFPVFVEPKPPEYISYQTVKSQSWELKLFSIDGYIAIAISVLYIILVAALVFELNRTQQRRKNLKNDKPNNTSSLVIAMAVSTFVTELLYGMKHMINVFLFDGCEERLYFNDLDNLVLAFIIASSALHLFICIIMSSQYRDTAKRLFWREKKKEENLKAILVESSVHPTTIGTNKSSETSNKTY
ncbi:hypothetical protein CRE_12964 [Caenorhabditis remanei]|uniref:G-protein coupled receptors family 1 profile domain-containing protein n=1 Tax=Caenorhabditis remanei TaxID=31234 RepID=E3N105_CAERE|nr:hypothetical protein CRE_12964 [Caenorhabditis remanei]